jgi:hypothetical protein
MVSSVFQFQSRVVSRKPACPMMDEWAIRCKLYQLGAVLTSPAIRTRSAAVGVTAFNVHLAKTKPDDCLTIEHDRRMTKQILASHDEKATRLALPRSFQPRKLPISLRSHPTDIELGAIKG